METITSLSQLDLTRLYTFADYLQWKFEERVELIRGAIVQMAAPRALHQRVSNGINGEILHALRKRKCEIFVAPLDVILPIPNSNGKESTVVQPDLFVLCDPDSKMIDGVCKGAPDLIVEVLSPGNRKHDVETKMALYEEAGVKEYWVAIPETLLIQRYELLENGKYHPAGIFSREDKIKSIAVPDLEIDLAEAFEKILLPKVD